MSIISITDKGKTITYHAHHMRDVIEPVKHSYTQAYTWLFQLDTSA